MGSSGAHKLQQVKVARVDVLCITDSMTTYGDNLPVFSG